MKKKFYSFSFTFFSTAVMPLLYTLTDPVIPMLIIGGIINFHNDLMFFIAAIIIFVVWVLFRGVRLYFTGLKYNTFIEIAWTVTPALILMIISVPSFALLYSNEVFVEPSNDEPEFESIQVKSAGLLETVDGEEEKRLKEANDIIFRNRVLVGLAFVAAMFVAWPYLVDYYNSSSSAPDSPGSSGSYIPSSPGSTVFMDYCRMYERASPVEQTDLLSVYEYWLSIGSTAAEAAAQTIAFGVERGIGLAEGK